MDKRPQSSNLVPLSFISSWSGGKDSCFAFMKAVELGWQPRVLLNMMNEKGLISRSHGIPADILQAQAKALNLPIKNIPASWEQYEEKFIGALKQLVEEEKTSSAVFGDIDLEAHRAWEEKVCKAAGIKAFLPLWQKERRALVSEMIRSGIKTYIVSCNETMGQDFLGKLLDETLIDKIESLGVDACGENGEYHTLVVNCPLFAYEIPVVFGQKIKHNAYWFIEMC